MLAPQHDRQLCVTQGDAKRTFRSIFNDGMQVDGVVGHTLPLHHGLNEGHGNRRHLFFKTQKPPVLREQGVGKTKLPHR